MQKTYEALLDKAFVRHPYKHTTIGFLKDIEDMPNQFAYSLSFFDRYYRPDNTTLLVVGDVEPERRVRAGRTALRRLEKGPRAARDAAASRRRPRKSASSSAGKGRPCRCC